MESTPKLATDTQRRPYHCGRTGSLHVHTSSTKQTNPSDDPQRQRCNQPWRTLGNHRCLHFCGATRNQGNATEDDGGQVTPLWQVHRLPHLQRQVPFPEGLPSRKRSWRQGARKREPAEFMGLSSVEDSVIKRP